MLQVIDLGDTQIFADAKDVYPAIVILAKDSPSPGAEVCTVRLRRNDPTDELAWFVNETAVRIPVSGLSPDGWQFDTPEIAALRRKLAQNSEPLGQHIKGEIYRGLISGLNEAFVVTTERRNELIADGRSHEILNTQMRI